MTKNEAIQLENEITQYLLTEADQKNVNAAFVIAQWCQTLGKSDKETDQ